MLTDYIQKNRLLLEQHIEKIFIDKIKSAPTGLQTYTDALTHLQNITPKGKLLRGIQVLLTYEMLKDEPTRNILNAAAALEIMQAAVLIQDDVMDRDYMRRGERSVFAKYMDVGNEQKTTDPLLYGQSMAVCVGDIGYFLAYELLNNSADDKEISRMIIDLFSREWQMVGAGQMMDVDFSSRVYEPTEDEVVTIYRYKTARYSFALPLSMGAIVAGANSSTVQQLDIFGEMLGIIFQIKDDELGLYGDEKTVGKPVGSDIRENKKTLFRSMLFKQVSTEEKHILSRIFGSSEGSEKNITYIKDLLAKYSIQKKLHAKTEGMKRTINDLIKELPVKEEYKSLLQELVRYVTSRKN